jgi:hypothetical protein
MQSRSATLRRLAILYVAVEEMHSVELQRLTAAVLQARNAIGSEQVAMRLARLDGQEALVAGDQVNWMMSQTRHENAAWRKQKLEEIRLRRVELNDAARQQYVASRLKREQIERVFDDIAKRMEIEKERRAQAVSDDRFLARRRWTDSREQKRKEQMIRTS